MPDDFSEAPKATIKIGGSEVADTFLDDLAELTVNLDLHLPSMFTLRLEDRDLTWSGGATLALGKEVEISMQARKQAANDPGSTGVIFKGEITALEPEFGDDGSVWLTVRGYDKGHRLHRGKKSRTFLKSKDSDLASTIASEVGLTADADATSITYDYILQNNQTNMEFLRERARRIGYWVYVNGADGKLCFQKAATPDDSSGPTLTWGKNLFSFSPRLSGAHQADLVKVVGWDSKTKAAILGQNTPAAPSNQAGQSGAGGAAAKTAFGGTSAEAIVTSEPVISVDDANAIAEGLGEHISRNYLWAEGKCEGDPTVLAGAVVTVELTVGVDDTTDAKFGGKYLVTSATHVYDGTEYWTQFSITGQDPYTFSALLGADAPASAQVPGVVTGIVTNLNDPDKLGRVKVKFPWMGKDPNGTELESDWVRLSAPMAGAQRGFLTIPEVNDEVLLAFEHGNADFPFILGGLWNNTDKPPVGTDKAVANGKVVQRMFKTTAGHTILLDDTANSEMVKILSKGGHLILVDDTSSAPQIKILSKAGHTVLLNDASGSEQIKILDKGGNSIIIDSVSNGITVKATGDIAIKGMNVNIEAQVGLSLKGTATAKLEAPVVDVKASGTGTFDGGGMATVKGGVVKIN